METWIIYVATAVVILILGILIQERIADKKAKKAAQNKPAEEPQPTPHFTQGEQQATPNISKTGIDILNEFLSRYSCPVVHSYEDDDWSYIVFQYQGAYIEADANKHNDELLFEYTPWNIPYTPDNLAWAHQTCHILTNDSKYTRVVCRYDSAKDQLKIVICIGGISPSMAVLDYFITVLFETAREMQKMHEQRNQKSEEEIAEDARRRALYYRAMQYNAPGRYLLNYKYLNANHLSLGQTIQQLFDVELVENMLSLTIVTEYGAEHITQRDKIASFDLFSALLKKDKKNNLIVSAIPAVLTLDTTFFHYTFTLHLVEQVKDNVFIRLTGMKVPYDHLQKELPDSVYTPQTISCMLCYETSGEHSFEKFGWAVAAARQAKREGQTLTEEQEELLRMSDGNLDYQITEGIRLANHEYYLQAIELLEPAYHKLCERYRYDDGDGYRKAIYVACRLGKCYGELRLFQKAIYYSSIAYKADRLDASYIYFQLLFHMQDIRLLEELSEEKQKMEKNLQDMAKRLEDLDETERARYDYIKDYYLFLYKMHAELMIQRKFFDAAYSDLQYLLQYEETQEYAQAKIDELDKIIPPEE
jgi:hypothetical protein